MYRRSCAVERVQEVDVAECKYDSNTCDQMIIKPYVCDICNKAFSQRGTLNKHKRTHTGEKLYVCDVCDKAFSRQGGLNTHKRIHTGETPYVCDICNKAFRYTISLNAHKRTHSHSAEMPYACDVCNKVFNQLSRLNKHISETLARHHMSVMYAAKHLMTREIYTDTNEVTLVRHRMAVIYARKLSQ